MHAALGVISSFISVGTFTINSVVRFMSKTLEIMFRCYSTRYPAG